MKQERYLHATAVVNDKILVSGGFSNNSTWLNSLELLMVHERCHNIHTQSLSPMNERRSGHALVTWNDSVIALGGNPGGYSSSSSVEKLNDLQLARCVEFYEANEPSTKSSCSCCL